MNDKTTNKVKVSKNEVLTQLIKSLYEMSKEAIRYQERSVEYYISIPKYLIALSTGAIVLSVNSLAVVSGPKAILFVSLTFFLITIIVCLLQFYYSSKGYRLMYNYKQLEKIEAELVFDKTFNPEDFKQSELDDVNYKNDDILKKLKKRNDRADFIFKVHNIVFLSGIVCLVVYYAFALEIFGSNTCQ